MKELKYYIIFDLEATCSEGDKFMGALDNKEVIELGAVKITPDFDLLPGSFSYQVKPILNPVLGDYCTNLTGITQEMVNSASDFKEVYEKFILWSGQPLLWMSWSDDYSLLSRECERRNIKPFPQKRFFDCREIMRLLRGRPAQGMDREIKTYEVDLQGIRRHRAADDCNLTAKILKQAYIKSRGWTV